MTEDELAAFLDEERKVVLATNGTRGVPHLVMLGFIRRGERLWAWSYAKAQKVRNVERDPRATLFVEAGDSYDTYRGASLECDVVIHRDLATVREFGLEMLPKYESEALADAIEKQAPKRVALEFVPWRKATYD